MKSKDLRFTTVDEAGEETINDIIGIIPNDKNSEETYVIFTDYSLEEDGEFIKKIWPIS